MELEWNTYNGDSWDIFHAQYMLDIILSTLLIDSKLQM
jgi:hypothetical protein